MSVSVCDQYDLVGRLLMEKFSAETVHSLGVILERIKLAIQNTACGDTLLTGGVAILPRQARMKFENDLRSVEWNLQRMGLRQSAMAIMNFRSELLAFKHEFSERYPRERAAFKIEEIEGAISREMGDTLFVRFSSEQAEWFNSPLKDWEAVIGRFPQVRGDIEESSLCFAFERYGAAIFHVLLVAELGVIELATLMGVAGDKPGWGAVDRLEKIFRTPYNERTPTQQKHSSVLEQSIPMLVAMKGAWRHKISHAGNKIVWLDTDFSPKVAEEIITAVSGFMRRLATDFATLAP